MSRILLLPLAILAMACLAPPAYCSTWWLPVDRKASACSLCPRKLTVANSLPPARSTTVVHSRPTNTSPLSDMGVHHPPPPTDDCNKTRTVNLNKKSRPRLIAFDALDQRSNATVLDLGRTQPSGEMNDAYTEFLSKSGSLRAPPYSA